MRTIASPSVTIQPWPFPTSPSSGVYWADPAGGAGYLADLGAVSGIPGISKKLRTRLRKFARDVGRKGLDKYAPVTSAFRSVEQNAAVGGASQSAHLEGEGVDISPDAAWWTDGGIVVVDWAARRAKLRVIYYPRHLHLDTRPAPGVLNLNPSLPGPQIGLPTVGGTPGTSGSFFFRS